MATQSLRPRRNPHRIHGIYAQGKALLQRLQRHASRSEMTIRFLPTTVALAIGLAAAALLSLPKTSADQPARPKIYSIAYARFKAVDLEKSRTFYSNVLGLKSGAESCKVLAEPCFAVNPYQSVQLTQTGANDRGSFLEEVGFNVSDVA